ncbi:MAG: InlB B-repeat-containing protein, partial [Spirochaetaceae bacterium]|nr:InlB B-repeat-containing protein [Spirochaetaceae bacterium]
MSKGINKRKHIAKITASSICSLLIFLCALLISSCPNPLINDLVDPKKIAFDTNGGSYVSTQTIFRGQQINRPKDPTRSGHNFEGWYRDNGTFAVGWDFGAVPSGDMTLYAKWYEIPIGPKLEGTASITGGPFTIGQVLIVDTTSITGSSGSFSFQWRTDGVNVGANINTYTIQGTDAGKVITCVVTSSDVSGNVIAVGQEVLFNLSINPAGLTHGDIVSFNNSSVVTGSAALKGNIVPVYCTLASPGTTTNRIVLSFMNTPMKMITVLGPSNYDYTVNNNDAINGVIWITPTSIHTDLTPLDPPTNVAFNKNGTITFTEDGNSTSAGATYTYTLFKDGVAHLDFVNQSITSGATPLGIANKMLENAGSYTVSVRANTTNPSYDSPSIPVSSNLLDVFSVNVNITGRINPEYITANTASGTANFSFCVFSGDAVTLTAYPDPNRYVTWGGGVVSGYDNSRTITGITGNINITATFDTASLTVVITPATTDVTFGSITGSLTATASVTPNDRTIIYQWYRNTIDSNTGGIFISGNTTAAYAIPASLAVG